MHTFQLHLTHLRIACLGKQVDEEISLYQHAAFKGLVDHNKALVSFDEHFQRLMRAAASCLAPMAHKTCSYSQNTPVATFATFATFVT